VDAGVLDELPGGVPFMRVGCMGNQIPPSLVSSDPEKHWTDTKESSLMLGAGASGGYGKQHATLGVTKRERSGVEFKNTEPAEQRTKEANRASAGTDDSS
jgi:hypothetical protein